MTCGSSDVKYCFDQGLLLSKGIIRGSCFVCWDSNPAAVHTDGHSRHGLFGYKGHWQNNASFKNHSKLKWCLLVAGIFRKLEGATNEIFSSLLVNLEAHG